MGSGVPFGVLEFGKRIETGWYSNRVCSFDVFTNLHLKRKALFKVVPRIETMQPSVDLKNAGGNQMKPESDGMFKLSISDRKTIQFKYFVH